MSWNGCFHMGPVTGPRPVVLAFVWAKQPSSGQYNCLGPVTGPYKNIPLITVYYYTPGSFFQLFLVKFPWTFIFPITPMTLTFSSILPWAGSWPMATSWPSSIPRVTRRRAFPCKSILCWQFPAASIETNIIFILCIWTDDDDDDDKFRLNDPWTSAFYIKMVY